MSSDVCRSELPAESKRLMENQVRVQRETGSRMQASRRKLPAFSMRAQFLSQLNSSQVLVISGTTGMPFPELGHIPLISDPGSSEPYIPVYCTRQFELGVQALSALNWFGLGKVRIG